MDMGVLSPEDWAQRPYWTRLTLAKMTTPTQSSNGVDHYKCAPSPSGVAKNIQTIPTRRKIRVLEGRSKRRFFDEPRGWRDDASLRPHHPCPYRKRCNNKEACGALMAQNATNNLNTTIASTSTIANNATVSNVIRFGQCCPGVNNQYPLCAVCMVGWRKSSTGECVKCEPSTQSTDTCGALPVGSHRSQHGLS